MTDTTNEPVDDVNLDKILYSYGVEQNLGKRKKVQILFMFAHSIQRLIVVNIQYGRSAIDVRAFPSVFDSTQNVHTILEPFIRQLDRVMTPMSETDITSVWEWLPKNIVDYYTSDEPNANFTIEDDPTEVPGSLGSDEYMALAEFGIYPQELSDEFLEDIFD